MKKVIRYILFVWIVLLFLPATFAQDISVKARLDTSSILIGEQTNLRLLVTAPVKAKISWPEINDTLISEIEVLRKSAIDTSFLEDNNVKYSQELRITSFDSGYYAVPPFHFLIDVDGLEREIETMAHLLEVHTVQVDTTQAFKDIMPIHDMPVTFMEVLPYTLGGLLAVAIVVLIFVLISRRKKKETPLLVRKKPVKPPHKQAIDALYDLKERKLWQKGALKDYYQGITDILRVYFERQFEVSAVELSTTEILEQILSDEVLCEYQKEIDSLFSESDLVKFAKSVPGPEENEAIWIQAKELIMETYNDSVQKKAKEEKLKALEESSVRKEGGSV
ncbi:MAG: hypothetical protein C0593_14160 [Marinilabiliales bacterium]|nr:MAG: hypothetical protein C0593_14160 [Marinilabiliales bacterium]